MIERSARSLAQEVIPEVDKFFVDLEQRFRDMDATDMERRAGLHIALTTLSRRAYDRAMKYQTAYERDRLRKLVEA